MIIYIRAFWEELKMGLEKSWNYKMNFFSEIGTIIILYVLLIFMDSGTGLSYIYPSGNADSKQLLLCGYMLYNFSMMGLITASNTISSEAMSGTLEHKYTSIIPMSVLQLAIFVQSFIIESIIAAVILVISRFFFHVSIPFSISSILIIIITSVGMYGAGLILGGIALKQKRIGRIVFILQIVFLFVSDTIINISDSIKAARFIPLTVGNNLLRGLAAYGEFNWNEFFILILECALWLAVGIIFFKIFERKAKREGKLGTY